jgi:hypothetical protein
MLCLTCFISKRSIPENIKTPVVKTPQILALELVAADTDYQEVSRLFDPYNSFGLCSTFRYTTLT